MIRAPADYGETECPTTDPVACVATPPHKPWQRRPDRLRRGAVTTPPQTGHADVRCLDGLCPSADGLIQCPLRGLMFDTRTGLVPHGDRTPQGRPPPQA